MKRTSRRFVLLTPVNPGNLRALFLRKIYVNLIEHLTNLNP